MYAPEVYEKAKEILEEMIRNGDFILDDRQYYYIYELNPGDPCPTDNSMDLYVSFSLKKENPSVPVEENLDCDVTVEQWNRDTYDDRTVFYGEDGNEIALDPGRTIIVQLPSFSADFNDKLTRNNVCVLKYE